MAGIINSYRKRRFAGPHYPYYADQYRQRGPQDI